MKYLFIIGGSGSGKTTLANILKEYAGDKFNILKGSTTRERRPGETDSDYTFLSEDAYNLIDKNNMFIGQSYHLMSPTKYGYSKENLHNEKHNVAILSIEGFLRAANQVSETDDVTLLNITFSDKPFVERDSRDANAEQKFNKAVLSTFMHKNDNGDVILKINGRHINYREMDVEKLSEYYEVLKCPRKH